MKQKCYIYTRVSTSMQVDGFSLDAQKNTVREYADRNDMIIVGEYCDEGKSGKSINGRPDFLRMLRHNGMAILLWPAAFTLPNALRAARDVKFTMVVSLASMALFRIVFSYILGIGFGWGAVGVWVAMILDWICRIACYLARYRSGKWESKARLSL